MIKDFHLSFRFLSPFSFDAFEWPDVPVDNEFYRHTLLSWARLRHRWALTRDHSMVLETEESMNDVCQSFLLTEFH